MRSWYAVRALAEGAEISIYDEIGAFGVSAKGFVEALAAIPDGAALTLRINSPGGSVFDAVAIHNALRRRAGPVAVWIDGVAASAASYVAMAGDEVVMPRNTFLMIHDPVGVAAGAAEEMRAMAEALDRIRASLLQGYVAKSGRPETEIAALMAKESWLDAEEAVALGLADRIAEPVRIAAVFDLARLGGAPAAFLAAAEAGADDGGDGDGESDDHNDGADGETAAVVPPSDAGPDENAAVAAAAEAKGATDVVSPNDPSVVDMGHVADSNMPPADAPAAPDAAPDAAAIRAEALGHARAILDLCRLAGLPERAAGFLDGGMSLDEVRAALLAARAGADPEIAPQHPQPGRAADARPWGEIVACAFPAQGPAHRKG